MDSPIPGAWAPLHVGGRSGPYREPAGLTVEGQKGGTIHRLVQLLFSSGICHTNHISVARASHVANSDINRQEIQNPPKEQGSNYLDNNTILTEPAGPGTDHAWPEPPLVVLCFNYACLGV